MASPQSAACWCRKNQWRHLVPASAHSTSSFFLSSFVFSFQQKSELLFVYLKRNWGFSLVKQIWFQLLQTQPPSFRHHSIFLLLKIILSSDWSILENKGFSLFKKSGSRFCTLNLLLLFIIIRIQNDFIQKESELAPISLF